jgi:hypothetical protein
MESLRGQPGLQEEHLLKNRGDAEKYLSLPDPPADADLSGFFEADKGIGDVGILDVRAGRSPGGHVAQLFGSEQFAIMTLTDRDILHELCRQAQRWLLAKVKHLLAGGVGPYFSLAAEEYVAPPLHGPDDFRDFIVRYEKPVIDLIHEAGGRVHVHCHGRIGRIFDGFIEMGTDVLHPFEPPPLGDITAAEAKSLARGKMCLEGNLQIATMYESTPEAIRAETTRLIEDAFDDRRGLIVCPSASPYIRGEGEQCYENFRAMVETVLNWRS